MQGVMVSEVASGGPAARAGLRGATEVVSTPFGRMTINGDIITAVDGTPIRQMIDLISYLEVHTMPGDVITLTIYRGGEYMDVPVTLQPRP